MGRRPFEPRARSGWRGSSRSVAARLTAQANRMLAKGEMHHDRTFRAARLRPRRALAASRPARPGELVGCGSAGSGLSEAAVREIRAAIDAGRPVVVEIEHRDFRPDGELRHPVIRGWEIG